MYNVWVTVVSIVPGGEELSRWLANWALDTVYTKALLLLRHCCYHSNRSWVPLMLHIKKSICVLYSAKIISQKSHGFMRLYTLAMFERLECYEMASHHPAFDARSERSKTGQWYIYWKQSKTGQRYIYWKQSKTGQWYIYRKQSKTGPWYIYWKQSKTGQWYIYWKPSKTGPWYIHWKQSKTGQWYIYWKQSKTGQWYIYWKQSKTGQRYIYWKQSKLVYVWEARMLWDGSTVISQESQLPIPKDTGLG